MSRRAAAAEGDDAGYAGSTPMYDPSAIEHMKLTLDDDSPYPVGGDDDDDDENEEEEQERFNRGRSRSRSLHGMDEDPATGVVLVDPQQIALVQNNPHGHEKPAEVIEKSGPLGQKDMETLQKGIEEAVKHKDSNALREEQEEQLDAEEERKSRICTNSAASSSSGEARRIKILMLGDSGVGKSSLIIRWTQDSFSTDLVGTVGVNFKTRKICAAGENVQVQVWDTAGQEQFHKITTSYYRGANGIMLVYDVSDRKSVENVEYWVKNIKSHASDSVHVALICNKVDLRNVAGMQCVDASFGQTFAGKFGVPYFETSAKESTNVEQAFHTLVTNIVEADKCNGASGGGGSSGSRHSISGAIGTGGGAAGGSGTTTPRGTDKSKKDKKDCVIS